VSSEIWGERNSAVSYKVKLDRVDAWIVKNSSWLALGIIAAAIAIRFVYADLCYLNPDEASHFDAASTNGWLEAYDASRQLAHPPLFILVIHGILFLGRKELVLRLPSLVGGTTALWFTFAWIRRNLGAIPALAGAGFLALSPAAVSVSTEVRQYGLLLLFVCGSLYATGRTFSERSARWAIVQGLFLLGALLTHYTAVVVLLSIGLFVFVCLWRDGLPRRVLVTIFISLLVLLTVLAWLYFEHVRGSIPFGRGASMDYLQTYYFSGARETPLGFMWRSLFGTFSYTVRARGLTILMMSAFVVGIATMLVSRKQTLKGMAVLIIFTFVAGFAASILQVFPFAGSRHQAYLLPFLAAGIAGAFSWLQRRVAVSVLVLAVVIAPYWVTRGRPDNDCRVYSRNDMSSAIEYIGQMVPRGSRLFVDSETHSVLRYYLERSDTHLSSTGFQAGVKEWPGGYLLVEPENRVWAFQADKVLEQVNESARLLRMASEEPLWVFSSAWLEPSLASKLRTRGNFDAKEFGLISVIRAPHWNQAQIEINWSNRYQVIDGFGAASAAVNPELSSVLMDFFYTASGIHLNFIRVEIWPDRAECEISLAPGECVPSSNATISKADLANARAAVLRSALVWGTEWSPPASMKSNSHTLAGGSFIGNPTNFSNLAHIQTTLVRLLGRTYGIPLYALSPQNEPDMNAEYDSCTWTPQQIHDYIPYLAAALNEAGYGSVKIMIAEQVHWDNSNSTTTMNDPNVASHVGILAAHEYGGCCSAHLSWNNLTTQHVWQTEASDSNPYDGSMISGLAYATQIHFALTDANVNAWHYWSLSGILFNDNEGLTDSSGNPAKRAYTLGNFSKFIRPGWMRVGVTNSTKLLVSAYTGTNGEAAIVVVNNGSAATNQAFFVGTKMGTSVVPWITSANFNLEAQTPVAVSSASFTYTIPPNSVVTFALPTLVSGKEK